MAQSSAVPTAKQPSTVKQPLSKMETLIKTFMQNSYHLQKDETKKNQKYELEIRFNTTKSAAKITRGDFNNVVRRLKSCGYTLKAEEGEEMLRISPKNQPQQEKKVRVEINGRQAIMAYCNNPEDIQLGSENNKVFEKEKKEAVDFTPRFECVAALSLETEVELEKIPTDLPDFQHMEKYFRYMKRVTLVPPNTTKSYHKVDLTVVKSGEGKNLKSSPLFAEDDTHVKYEIEVEYVSDDKEIPFNYVGTIFRKNLKEEFQKVMSYIMSGLQQSIFPISREEQEAVVTDYRNLMGYSSSPDRRNQFYGPKPTALYMNKLKEIVESYPYTVTEKADGDRKLLFINDKGRMYFITMQMKIQYTGVNVTDKKLFGTLLDGEHVTRRKSKKRQDPLNLYLIFDIYASEGKNLVTTLPLMDCAKETKSRYALFQNVATDLGKEQNATTLVIQAKKFYQSTDTETILAKAQEVLKQEFEYDTDGLIFTPACTAVNGNPMNRVVSPNPTWEYCYKWKEVETVDFKVKWSVPTVKFQKVTLSLNGWKDNPKGKIIPAKLNLDDSERIQAEDGEIINSGDIVEFRYINNIEVNEQERWIPYRNRTDKSEPNSGKVYNDMMANKDKTISRNYFTDGVMDCSEDYFLRADDNKKIMPQLRVFHNCIKDKLIQAATVLCPQVKGKNTISLIDLAVGKANDLNKWKRHNVTFVLGIDISSDNITNTYYNEEQDLSPNSTLEKVILLEGDASKRIRVASDASFSMKKEDQSKVREVFENEAVRNGFQIVSVQFALHYMFKDESTLHGFMRNLQEITMEGGIFIGTCFDGTEVDKLLIKQSEPKYVINDLFYIEKQYKEYGGLEGAATVGKKVNVFMKSIGKHHEEYLVNFPYLTALLHTYGFDPITQKEFKQVNLPEDQTFKAMYKQLRQRNMPEPEKSISFLNRFFIYRKTRSLKEEELNDLMPHVRSPPKRKSPELLPSESGSASKRQAVPKFDKEITKLTERVTIAAIESKK